MNVLVLNVGSSSLKFQVIATDLERIRQDYDERLCKGEVERIGGEAIVTVQSGQSQKRKLTAPLRDIHAALDFVLRCVVSDDSDISQIKSSADIQAVGHRVVHGREVFTESALIDDKVLQALRIALRWRRCTIPATCKALRRRGRLFGKDTPQVAVFDTAFHHSIPEQAYLYAIPSRFGTIWCTPLWIPRHLVSLYRVPLSHAARITREQTKLSRFI